MIIITLFSCILTFQKHCVMCVRVCTTMYVHTCTIIIIIIITLLIFDDYYYTVFLHTYLSETKFHCVMCVRVCTYVFVHDYVRAHVHSFMYYDDNRTLLLLLKSFPAYLPFRNKTIALCAHVCARTYSCTTMYVHTCTHYFSMMIIT